MPDADWTYSRMRGQIAEKEVLLEKVTVTGQAPQISVKDAIAYRSLSGKIMATGTFAEKKRLVRSCVDKITMTPDTLEVEIQFKVPEAIGAYTGSGGPLRHIAPMILAAWLVRKYKLAKNGRHGLD